MPRFAFLVAFSFLLFLPGAAQALVNINTATVAELVTLPYVGTSTAERIIAGRPYSAPSDIQRISGFGGGPGTRNYDAIIGEISVSGETAVAAAENTATVTTASSGSSSSGGTVQATAIKPADSYPLTGIALSAPKRAYAGELIAFEAGPSDGRRGRKIRYRWNFGDGATDTAATPKHRYEYPGTYAIAVEGYYHNETILARQNITILPLDLQLEIISSEQARIKNRGEHELDIGGMKLIGEETRVFAPHTILLPAQSLIVALRLSGSVTLEDAGGRTLAAGGTATPPAAAAAPVAPRAAPRAAAATSPKTAAAAEPPEIASTSVEGSETPAAASLHETAAAGNAGLPAAAWPYAGLLAVIAFGFIAIFSTMAPKGG